VGDATLEEGVGECKGPVANQEGVGGGNPPPVADRGTEQNASSSQPGRGGRGPPPRSSLNGKVKSL